MNTNTPSSVAMKTLNISNDFFMLITRMAFVETMKILNYFLETVRDELSSFAPSEKQSNELYNVNVTILGTIERIVDTEEFKQKWRDFSENIANLLKLLLEKVSDTTENEVNSIIKNLTKLVEKNVKNAVFGAGSGALRGACALPPVLPFCMMANIASTSANVGGETIITMMNSASKMAEAFSKVFGDTALPMAETIQKARDFFDYIESMKNSITDNVSNIQEQIQDKTTNLQNKLNEKLDNVSEKINASKV
jgi:gas vesicle protein